MALISCSCCSFFLQTGNVNPGEAGLSLTYALSLTGLLNMLVRMYTEVETQMVSVERMEQYTHIESEVNDHRLNNENLECFF